MSNTDYITRRTTILGVPTTIITPIINNKSSSTTSENTFNPYKKYSEEERRIYRENKKDFIKLKLQMEQQRILFRQLNYSYDS